MQRIVIVGCSGTGKSTLAAELGRRLGLPVVHLDALFWEPGWVQPDRTVFRRRVTEALAGGRWISEGGYISETSRLRLPTADLIVWLNRPLWLRLWRVTLRTLRYWGATRPDMGAGCKEKLDLEFLTYIWTYDRKVRPRMEAAIAEYAGDAPLIQLNSDREVADFLAKFPAATPVQS